MNFFEALARGVKGVLQGQILRVTTRKHEDKEYVKATIGIPGLFINFDVNIPEKLIPDALEGREIQLSPTLKIGKYNAPEISFYVEKIISSDDESRADMANMSDDDHWA
ncbi:MAG: hypothetical protein CVV41_09840 [Candidatus Riflebacteria bacterium HGW-Riflebacteria-1]|jgi:hypothetical protein|nr:MAG: hypothetical protein CVV41_09840 [Candidatus Riflebacteria bacterium HGW-Riflebacteria-1]